MQWSRYLRVIRGCKKKDRQCNGQDTKGKLEAVNRRIDNAVIKICNGN